MSDRSWESIGSEFGKVLEKTEYKKKIKKMKKSSIMVGLGVGCLLIWFMAARWIYRGVTGAEEKEAMAEMVADCVCSSVDDCLAKDKIDCAWQILNRDEILIDLKGKFKIIKAESVKFIELGEYKEGWNNLAKQDLRYNQYKLIAYKYEYLNLVIDELIEEGDLKKAKLYAMKGSDEHNTEGWTESETNDFDKNKTQQKLLLKKVEEFE
jgi:hypothetical protein